MIQTCDLCEYRCDALSGYFCGFYLSHEGFYCKFNLKFNYFFTVAVAGVLFPTICPFNSVCSL